MRLNLAPRPARQTDDGFTLVEVLVTVAIMGVIAAGLAGTVISYLKHTVNTQSRMTESLELQFVTAYWQRDVSSIGVRDHNYNDAAGVHAFELLKSVNVSPCAGAADLDHVITPSWSEYVNPSSDPDLESDDEDARYPVTVTYGTRGAAGDLELVRVRCGSEDATTVVAEHLVDVDATCTGGVADCDDAGSVPERISLTLSVRDPEGNGKTDIVDQTIQGERRQS